MAQEEPQFSDFPVGTIACVKGQKVSLCVRSHKEVKERKLILCTWFDKQGQIHNDAFPVEMLEERMLYKIPMPIEYTAFNLQDRPPVITLKEHD